MDAKILRNRVRRRTNSGCARSRACASDVVHVDAVHEVCRVHSLRRWSSSSSEEDEVQLGDDFFADLSSLLNPKKEEEPQPQAISLSRSILSRARRVQRHGRKMQFWQTFEMVTFEVVKIPSFIPPSVAAKMLALSKATGDTGTLTFSMTESQLDFSLLDDGVDGDGDSVVSADSDSAQDVPEVDAVPVPVSVPTSVPRVRSPPPLIVIPMVASVGRAARLRAKRRRKEERRLVRAARAKERMERQARGESVVLAKPVAADTMSAEDLAAACGTDMFAIQTEIMALRKRVSNAEMEIKQAQYLAGSKQVATQTVNTGASKSAAAVSSASAEGSLGCCRGCSPDDS